MEWIIVDDGTDKIKDLIDAAGISQIKYFSIDKKMTLGAKRNYMHTKTQGAIIVYMDDDDYYPPDRVRHAVETLQNNPKALCAGSSELYLYFKHISKMYQCGPYGPNHATAGTFAFKKELLAITKYDETASLAEEKAFLKNYTIPFVQLDPMKSILVFSHEHNTFNKRKLLENPHPDFLKESNKTVDMFIRSDDEQPIKKFFMHDIDDLLLKYEPGEAKMKPDVLKQIKEIEEERNKMKGNQESGGMPQIIVERPGGQKSALTAQEIVQLLSSQQEQLKVLSARNAQLETLLKELQHKLINGSSPEIPTVLFREPTQGTYGSPNPSL
jgi:hypothetical protein